MQEAQNCPENVDNIDAKLVFFQLRRQNQVLPAHYAENGDRKVSNEDPDDHHYYRAYITGLFEHSLRQNS